VKVVSDFYLNWMISWWMTKNLSNLGNHKNSSKE
jgi:hypothetical protein